MVAKQDKNTASGTRRRSKQRDLMMLAIFLISIFLINSIGSFSFSRFDLTTEGRYSLSDATENALDSLDEAVFVRVYLTGNLSADFKQMEIAIRELLDEFRAISSYVEYEFIDPSAEPDEQLRQAVYQQLADQGLKYTNDFETESGKRSEKIIWPGAIISYRGRELPVNLLKSHLGQQRNMLINNSIQQLEFEIMSALNRLAKPAKPLVAFLQGHGELDSLETASAAEMLSEFYQVERITINGKLNALDGVDALIIAKPDTFFSDKDKFILDQFVMHGGKVLWFMEPVLASLDSLMEGQRMTFSLRLDDKMNMDDMPFSYGARVNANLIQDQTAMPIRLVTGQVGNQPRFELFPWFYSPLVLHTSPHPITKDLDGIKTEFVCTIDTTGKIGIKKTVLLTSSQRTKVMTVPGPISFNILREPPSDAQFNKPYQTLAVLLEGEFESVFKGRLPQDVTDNPKFKYAERSPQNAMIVVSDGDIIANTVNRERGIYYPLGYDRSTDRMYGNAEFVENALFYLLDDSGLISARAKEFKIRLLDQKRINEDRTMWQIVNTGVPILVVILFAFFQAWQRKRKYTKSQKAA